MKKYTILLFFSFLLSLSGIMAQNHVTISGYVREKGSKELLPGVNIYIPGHRIGTTTNNYGFYSLSLSPGEYSITYSYVGYQTHELHILLNENKTYDIDLEGSITLKEIEVTAERAERFSESDRMSIVSIPVKQIQNIPALLGEKDVFKALQLMPGVQKGTEGSSGLYVRGGGPDQNLIILDDAPVYNASHLFGFFSVFNGDAIKSIELTKGGFQARHGGRLSSVIEMTMKDGNKEQIKGSGGIGLLSSRLTLEGPIVKEKSSFLISGRRTYADALIRPFLPKDEKFGYYFYDLNTKLNYDFGPKNKLYVSAYFGRDKFQFKQKYNNATEKAGLYWQNKTATLRWNHMFTNKLFSNTSLIFSEYAMKIFNDYKSQHEHYKLEYNSGIKDVGLKYDLEYYHSPIYSLRSGLQTTYHHFFPNVIIELDNNNVTDWNHRLAYKSMESAMYLENHLNLIPELKINAGLRLAHFVANNKHYFSPEPRLSVNYVVREGLAAKAAYSMMTQSIHLLSNTGIGLPTDLWVPSTDRVAPQQSQQYSAGIAYDIPKNDLLFSAEAYYKKSNNIIGYKPGASFLLLDDPSGAQSFTWQDNVAAGKGESYGIELLLQKKTGRTSGWVGYTLSWTQLQFDEINFGKKFWARYDRRHDISIVAIHEINDRITLSGTWVYGTGNAITLPIATFVSKPHIPYNGQSWDMYYYPHEIYDYNEMNSSRMKAYHRLDLAIQFHRSLKHYDQTWEVGLYNAYSRHNPFFYYIDYEYDDNNVTSKLKQRALFPIIPSISYNFKF